MRYRKKPVVIEAMQFTGHNAEDIRAALGMPEVPINESFVGSMEIQTLEGTMRADLLDWIIKGVKGEFYPCKPEIFSATYELAE